MSEFEEYEKVATVNAKIFEKGDEDGFTHREGHHGAMEDARYGIKPDLIPFIKSIENQQFRGDFGANHILVAKTGERWLVENSIFKNTYRKVLKNKA